MLEFSVLNLILLIGLFQGMVFITLTLVVKPSLSKKLLAWILILLFLSTSTVVFYTEVDFSMLSFAARTLVDAFPDDIITPLGPLVLFYIKSLFEKNFTVNKYEKLQFLPVIVELIPCLATLLLIISYNADLIEKNEIDHWLRPIDNYYRYIQEPVQSILLLSYLFYCWRYLSTIRKIADRRTYRWAHDLIIALFTVTFTWLFFILIDFTPYEPIVDDFIGGRYPLFILVASLFYYLSIKQLIQVTPFRPNEMSLSEIKDIVQLMTDTVSKNKLYKDPKLKLAQLCEVTGANQKSISFILNHYLQIGFNEYINQFRIAEAIDKMNDQALKQITFEGLAYKVGFASRATFYRAFKKQTGQDPSTYIQT